MFFGVGDQLADSGDQEPCQHGYFKHDVLLWFFTVDLCNVTEYVTNSSARFKSGFHAFSRVLNKAFCDGKMAEY